MTTQTNFFNEFEFTLPAAFIHPTAYEFDPRDRFLCGPFVALLLNSKRDQTERISEWLRRSDELVQYIIKDKSSSDFVIEWWTHRQHIFEVTEKPIVEYGILKLQNKSEKSQLWIRNLNIREVRPE